MSSEIDFAALRRAAREVMARAYAPYSGFPVGAAAVGVEGHIVRGCNVENVSYGLGVCAEVALVSAAVSSGVRQLRAISVCDAHGRILTPCGRCRQVLLEFGGPGMIVDTVHGPRALAELLPDAFGPADLDRVGEAR
ncbi:cytidine deaminase [Gordonia hirsuta DSM 44140 = NBRC 16056]|uniref:Cytidine deaminase n=1 Tax=Gordonia hirsuta DSM 44140 = NBRC 16056 TaxID=1121927 RepID=L7L6X5_9ACTN|nr:cytidine deaminase [Gordonia hirsuta]GAC56684.1 cytidine deaminase [Gordonia hirsuta DSM 44140 = NBRC 16056]